MTADLLRIEGAALVRGGRLLFEGLDLAIGPGEAALVSGPNGVGKSSLLRLAAGLLTASAGRVERAPMALADEHVALDERLPLGRSLAFWAQLDGRDPASGMEAMGIAHLADVPVRMLSTGQRKRAALARLIASDQPLWLLDEPANGLDADGLVRLASALTVARKAGRAVLAASHRPIRTRRLPSGGARMIPLISRELRLALAGGAALMPLIFFLLVATLFPFAVGPDGPLLARTGGGALWMAALLAALLPVDRLIEPDRAAGVLDQLTLRGMSEETIALAKLAGHWLSFGPPLMLAALPGAALLKLPPDVLMRVELGLLVGTPGLAALTVGVAALTAGLRRSGALAGLLMLPLAVPLLIFGAGLVERGFSAGAIQLLAAASLLLVAGTPFAAGAAMRAARD